MPTGRVGRTENTGGDDRPGSRAAKSVQFPGATPQPALFRGIFPDYVTSSTAVSAHLAKNWRLAGSGTSIR